MYSNSLVCVSASFEGSEMLYSEWFSASLVVPVVELEASDGSISVALAMPGSSSTSSVEVLVLVSVKWISTTRLPLTFRCFLFTATSTSCRSMEHFLCSFVLSALYSAAFWFCSFRSFPLSSLLMRFTVVTQSMLCLSHIAAAFPETITNTFAFYDVLLLSVATTHRRNPSISSLLHQFFPFFALICDNLWYVTKFCVLFTTFSLTTDHNTENQLKLTHSRLTFVYISGAQRWRIATVAKCANLRFLTKTCYGYCTILLICPILLWDA